MARRNARERKRVQAVNSAFVRLRKCVPVENRNKRLSKVKTLHRAIEYIGALEKVLRESDQLASANDTATASLHQTSLVNTETTIHPVVIQQQFEKCFPSLQGDTATVFLSGQSAVSAELSVIQSSLMTDDLNNKFYSSSSGKCPFTNSSY